MEAALASSLQAATGHRLPHPAQAPGWTSNENGLAATKSLQAVID
jgi:hypothetical protein